MEPSPNYEEVAHHQLDARSSAQTKINGVDIPFGISSILDKQIEERALQ